MKLPAACLLLLTALSSAAASAKDLGVQGNAWPIVEVDIRQMLVESAARVDWKEVQEQATHSAKNYLGNLPKRNLPSPEKTTTAWIDPSIVVSSDIQAPIKQPDGSFAWQVLVPKGTVVNPLKQIRPATAFLLFDGSNESQMKFVQDVLKREQNRVVPVEAGAGDMKTGAETLARPLFYANDAMMSRFQVRYLPALVYPGTGAQELYLGVTSFAAPYNAAEVFSAWPVLTETNTAKREAR